MDMSSLASSILATQAGGTQSNIAAMMIRSNAAAERSTVLTLLGAAQQSSQANLAAGVGRNLDVMA
jgi:hypothetical protein